MYLARCQVVVLFDSYHLGVSEIDAPQKLIIIIDNRKKNYFRPGLKWSEAPSILTRTTLVSSRGRYEQQVTLQGMVSETCGSWYSRSLQHSSTSQ